MARHKQGRFPFAIPKVKRAKYRCPCGSNNIGISYAEPYGGPVIVDNGSTTVIIDATGTTDQPDGMQALNYECAACGRRFETLEELEAPYVNPNPCGGGIPVTTGLVTTRVVGWTQCKGDCDTCLRKKGLRRVED